MRRKKKDENVAEEEVALAPIETVAESDAGKPEVKEKKEQSQSLFKKIGGLIDTVNGVIPTATEFYDHWIKPVYDNRAQIKRRLNGICTAISLIFFVACVPMLLFSNLSNGMGLGWDIALYVCVGIYLATLLSLLIVTVASNKCSSTEAAKRRKKVRSVILFVVRIASLAIGITALVIADNEKGSAFNTLAMIFAIISIIFSALPIFFGSLLGFFKWLISPAKIKRTFSFVALEWNQMLDSDRAPEKPYKKLIKRNKPKIDACLDKYFLPVWEKKYVKNIDAEDIVEVLNGVDEADRNISEWILKEVFAYAEECGYKDGNPCKELELTGGIEFEAKQKKHEEPAEKKVGFFEKMRLKFNRGKENKGAEEPEDEEAGAVVKK